MPSDAAPTPTGRILALDLGEKRVGVAVSDELKLTTRRLPALPRSNWKRLLGEISKICQEFDVRGVVVGLPLRLDGTEGDAAQGVRRIVRNLSLSLTIPVFLQDERLTSKAAEQILRQSGVKGDEVSELIDGEAAAIILADFLSQHHQRDAKRA